MVEVFAAFVSFEALVIAVCAGALVQLVKVILDITMGHENRRKSVFVTRVVLPASGSIFGALLALIPLLHPDILVERAVTRELTGFDATLGFMVWGGFLGVFADWAYSKAKAWRQSAPTKKARTARTRTSE